LPAAISEALDYDRVLSVPSTACRLFSSRLLRYRNWRKSLADDLLDDDSPGRFVGPMGRCLISSASPPSGSNCISFSAEPAIVFWIFSPSQLGAGFFVFAAFGAPLSQRAHQQSPRL
jgi:hypothetical protein